MGKAFKKPNNSKRKKPDQRAVRTQREVKTFLSGIHDAVVGQTPDLDDDNLYDDPNEIAIVQNELIHDPYA